MNPIHTQAYTVRNYELGPHQAAHFRTLVDYIQETADAHIREAGVSVREFLEKGLLWVLSAYRLEVVRYPRAGEAVTVKTWHCGRHGWFYLRDFVIRDAEGVPVAAAATSWAVIDIVKRGHADGGTNCLDLPFHEERALEGGIKPIPALDSPQPCEPFTVGSGCLDMYNHVNHAFYIQWALDSVSQATGSGSLPCSVEASFKAEAVSGDRLTPCLQSGAEEGTWLHSLVRDSDGREMVRLRTRWKPE